MSQDFETLHESHESFENGFQPMRLYNALEIMSGGPKRVVCSICGRWQRFCSLDSDMAKQQMERRGWKIILDGDDICPKCVNEGDGR